MAFDPFWVSIYTIAMLDLGDILITCSLEARTILLNRWLFLRTFSISSDEIWLLVFLLLKGIHTILRYDLDWGSQANETLSVLEESELLTYFLISWRLEPEETLLVVMTIPLSSTQMKLAIVLDLIVLKAQLMLMTCELEFLMNSLVILLFIGMITCFLEGSLVWICCLSCW